MAENIAKLQQIVHDAAGRISGKFGGSASDTEAISQMLTKVALTRRFTADELNQLGERGIDATGIIARDMGCTPDQVRAEAQAGNLDSDKVISALLKDTGKLYY